MEATLRSMTQALARSLRMAAREQRDTIGDVPRETHLVRDEQQVAAFILKLLDQLEHLGRHLGIEGGGWLIQQHDLRLDRDGAGDGHPLALAAGKLRRALVRVVEQTKAPQRALGQLARLGGCATVHLFERQGDVPQGGEMREKIVGLEDRADGAPVSQQRLVGVVHARAVERDRARAGVFQPRHKPQQRGLAAA